jgi:TldD protein
VSPTLETPLHTLLAELVADLKRQAPYAAALLTSGSGTRLTLNKGEQSLHTPDPSQGVVFTIFTGEHFEEYATSDLALDRLARAVRDWARDVYRRLPTDTGGEAYRRFPTGTDGDLYRRLPAGMGGVRVPPASSPVWGLQHFQTPCQIPPNSLSLPEKLERMRAIQQQALSFHPQIRNANLYYSDQLETKLFISGSRQMLQEIARTSLFLDIIVADGPIMQHNWLSKTGTGGLEITEVSESELASTCETALRLLSAEKIEPGLYDIVTDPSISGTIAHESFGHGVELDLFPKGRARAAAYLGQRVAAPDVQLYDDPTIPGAFASYFFDDEGQPAAPTHILQDGVFVAPLSDLMSATFTRRLRTANGRREHYGRKSYARMTNTFFGAGTSTPEELIASLEHGIYLHQAGSGMEDPLGWGVQVTAHYGEEIINGRPTGRLFAPIGVTGYVPDLLHSISGIGNDLALDGGWCGKGHKEWLPVSSGGPHLRMKARLG